MDWLAVLGTTLQQFIGRDAVVIAMAAVGLNVHFGYTGLLNFGQVAWMAVGGYALAISAQMWGWGLWPAFFFALLMSAVFSVLMGVPTLRLRGDYLAIATVAASAIVKTVFKHGKWAGGGDGVFGPRRNAPPGSDNWSAGFTPGFVRRSDFSIQFSGFKLNAQTLWLLGVSWIAVAAAALVIMALMKSPWGRVLRAIREDENAARALGKNTFGFKMQALIIGGACGAMAGVLQALATAQANPEDFNPQVTYIAWAALIIGGIASPAGPILGAMVFYGIVAFTDAILRQAQSVGMINYLTGDEIANLRFILVGLALVLAMVLRPEGILGNKKEMALDAR